jgi:hypothetical protein
MGLGLEPSSVLAGRAEEYKEKKEAEVQASNQLTRKYLYSLTIHLPSQLPLSCIQVPSRSFPCCSDLPLP